MNNNIDTYEKQYWDNKKYLKSQCIPYTFSALMYLKIQKYNFIQKIEIKRHLIDSYDSIKDKNIFSEYHYYLEITFKKQDCIFKYIIDCDDSYTIAFYKSKYNPKKIETISIKKLKEEFLQCNENSLTSIIVKDISFIVNEIYNKKYI